jgi:rubrerythrin
MICLIKIRKFWKCLLIHYRRWVIEEMPEKTIQALFELAINWETQARDLYANFANLFNHEPKVSAFWIHLSKDESGHIDVLNDLLKKTPTENLLMAVGNEQWTSVTRVEGLIREASTRKVLTLNDAYELAHQLEMSELNTLFKMLVNDYIPDKEGHKFILSDVTEHIERLMQLGEEYAQSQRSRINVRSI